MVYRLILPDWVKATPGWDNRKTPGVVEGEFTFDEVLEYNLAGYNCYFLPNYPSDYDSSRNVEGADVDTFGFVFVDLDMKDYNTGVKGRSHNYATKAAFIEVLKSFKLPPTSIVDSGGGVHAYWQVSDLDVMSYLRLQRRLGRYFSTDPAVAKIYQLMRVPGTVNVKDPDKPKLCSVVEATGNEYTCEDLDKALPPISPEDEAYCKLHHDKTYNLVVQKEVSEELPAKWYKLAKKGSEPYRLFYEAQKDRSAADYRLAHLLFAAGFTIDQARPVLMQTQKASTRAGVHRYNYADNILTKVYSAVAAEEDADEPETMLSESVADILSRKPGIGYDGKRFECDEIFDSTECGFRLGHVLGLIGGAGTGKTTNALNYFYHFAHLNPDYIHLFVSLEQPVKEIANRWARMAQGNPTLAKMVHVLGNYNDDGTYRNLGIQEVEDYIKLLEKKTGKKVGSVVVDHIGVLKKETRNGEFQGLIEICQYMKALAVNCQVFLVMQSQAPREKAGIGDIELDKDAAYGTAQFEWYVDWLVTTWQPLKRVYKEAPHMTVTCFKYCKIRHKNIRKDNIKEDTVYGLMFDPETELLRRLDEDEKKAFDFFSAKAVNLRKRDKRTEPGTVHDVDWAPRKVKLSARDATDNQD